ncbi:MAG: hypothetical protein US52_C0011G0015, partial [candidate division WS6 bacterium GW2011_GWA2_37_6]
KSIMKRIMHSFNSLPVVKDIDGNKVMIKAAERWVDNSYRAIDLAVKRINLDFNDINILLYAFLSGLGAIAGDSIKSFFKRRVNIKPGKAWIPFDQIDYIFGGILFVLPYIQLDIIYYVLIFILYLIIHPITTVIGYYIKLKDSPI